MCFLLPGGIICDHAINARTGVMTFDRARVQPPAARLVTVDEALKVSAGQARDGHPLQHLIDGYGRLK